MEYYRVLGGPSDLVGSLGLLKLPSYIFDVFVFDGLRERVVRESQEALLEGRSVLITGPPGVGKTALMAVVLKNMFEVGYKIGFIEPFSSYVGSEHAERGVVVFYDDLVKLNRSALRSIAVNRPPLLLATVRREDLRELRRVLGVKVDRLFRVFSLRAFGPEGIRRILYGIAEKENIRVVPEAVDIVVRKSGGLPIYVWQMVRDLRVQRRAVLDVEFAEKIPSGMLEYVDSILWRILGASKEKVEALLTLRIIVDMPNNEIHQDLLNVLFATVKAYINKSEVNLKTALMSQTLDRLVRYLIKTPRYTFKIPHDSWVDVLKGKSHGLISSDISKINSLFPFETRREILENAVSYFEREILPKIEDKDRLEEFSKELQLLGITLGQVNIDALKILLDALTSDIKKLEKRVKSCGREVRDTKAKGECLLLMVAYALKKGDHRRLNRAVLKLVEFQKHLSKRDVQIIDIVLGILQSRPEIAIYNVKKALQFYSLEDILNLYRLLLLYIPIKNFSDLVLTVAIASDLRRALFSSNTLELKYLVERSDLKEFLKELYQIYTQSRELCLEILAATKEYLIEKLKRAPPREKVSALRSLARFSQKFRRDLGDLINYFVLSSAELRELPLEDIVPYLKALLWVTKDSSFVKDYLVVLADILMGLSKEAVLDYYLVLASLRRTILKLKVVGGRSLVADLDALVARLIARDLETLEFVLGNIHPSQCSLISRNLGFIVDFLRSFAGSKRVFRALDVLSVLASRCGKYLKDPKVLGTVEAFLGSILGNADRAFFLGFLEHTKKMDLSPFILILRDTIVRLWPEVSKDPLSFMERVLGVESTNSLMVVSLLLDEAIKRGVRVDISDSFLKRLENFGDRSHRSMLVEVLKRLLLISGDAGLVAWVFSFGYSRSILDKLLSDSELMETIRQRISKNEILMLAILLRMSDNLDIFRKLVSVFGGEIRAFLSGLGPEDKRALFVAIEHLTKNGRAVLDLLEMR